MTILRIADSDHLTAPGTVPGVTLRLRLILAGLAVALLGVGTLAGWQVADRTHPGVCLAMDDGACAVEVTSHRDGTVTVRRAFPGEESREARVADDCLRPGPLEPGQCPEWVANWAPAEARP